MPILHPETSGDRSQLNETKPLVQMTGMDVALHYGIELQHTEPQILCNLQAVQHQFFTDMLSSARGGYCITGIANMSAASDVIGMQNIQPNNFSVMTYSQART